MLRRAPAFNVRINRHSAPSAPRRQFHQSQSLFAPCHSGPFEDIEQQNLVRYREQERELCELRSFMCKLKLEPSKLDANGKSIYRRQLELHRAHREEEHKTMIKDVESFKEGLEKKIIDIQQAMKQLPNLQNQAEEAMKNLKALKDFDTESSEFLDRDSTSHLAPKYSRR